MSDAHPANRPDTGADHHDDHAATGGHDDDHGAGHGHDDEALGPVDLLAWAYGLAGILAGGLVALVLILATGRFGS